MALSEPVLQTHILQVWTHCEEEATNFVISMCDS